MLCHGSPLSVPLNSLVRGDLWLYMTLTAREQSISCLSTGSVCHSVIFWRLKQVVMGSLTAWLNWPAHAVNNDVTGERTVGKEKERQRGVRAIKIYLVRTQVAHWHCWFVLVGGYAGQILMKLSETLILWSQRNRQGVVRVSRIYLLEIVNVCTKLLGYSFLVQIGWSIP